MGIQIPPVRPTCDTLWTDMTGDHVKGGGGMAPTEKAILERFKASIARRFEVHKMILFGSRARGDADPESDLDVVVILEGEPDSGAKDYVSHCAWEAGYDQGIVVVPVVFGRKAWEEGPERRSLFVQAVETEGVPV